MFQAGEIIYYRRPEDCRALRGEIISYAGGCYIIKGMRTATRSTRPLLTIPASQVLPVQAVRKSKKYSRENGNGAGMCIPAAESVLRSQIGAVRLGLTEEQILRAKAMIELRRRIVCSLATSNGIACTSADYEFQEIVSEFTVAALGAIRATTSKSPLQELEEFRAFIEGQTAESKIMTTIARTGKTAVVRYLKKRRKYRLTHMDLCAYNIERRMAV